MLILTIHVYLITYKLCIMVMLALALVRNFLLVNMSGSELLSAGSKLDFFMIYIV